MNLELYKKIYLIGIGGIGMSALARYFNAKEKSVFGYDKVKSDLCIKLQNEGIQIDYIDSALNNRAITTNIVPPISRFPAVFNNGNTSCFDFFICLENMGYKTPTNTIPNI